MKKLIISSLILLLTGVSHAGGGAKLDLMEANIDPHNQQSLRNGAKLFVNYCLSCHGAEFMRYNRTGKDLGLTDEQVIDNLMFTADKVGEVMKVAMTKEDGNKWFGKAPPDLSVIARSHGVDWLYTYLMTFYSDPSRPFGVNNAVLKGASMPHVMQDLQGLQKPIFKTEKGEDGKEHQVISGYELIEEGSRTPEQYKRDVRDLVNYLDYMGEPAKLERQALGVKVLFFLAFFFVFAYLLKREFWRDVH